MIDAGLKDGLRSERSSAIEAKVRGAVYSILSRLFIREVDKPLLKAFRTDENLGFLGKLLHGLKGKNDEEIIDDLCAEYSALFLLSGNSLSPYESVQAIEDGALCGTPAVETLQFYKRAGLVLPDGCAIFPDHFGMELEFMAHLCEMEASQSTSGTDYKALEAEFMRLHIGRWHKPFLEKVAKCSESSFYRELAIITMEFIGSEEVYLDGNAHLP